MAHAAKKLLRKELKRRIAALSDIEKERQSSVVTNKLLKTDVYKRSKRISVFLSMDDEIRTTKILHHILEDRKECFIPRYTSTTMDMLKMHSMEDFDSLPLTKWNIKQPADDDSTRDNALETGGLDLILVPGLGFTKDGLRLGRGRGYYDTYLSRCKERYHKIPYTIALTFNEQICDSIPTSESDVPIDLVLCADEE